jgi:hypothetical protein
MIKRNLIGFSAFEIVTPWFLGRFVIRPNPEEASPKGV